MNVEELIDELASLPPDRPVYTSFRQEDGSLGCTEVLHVTNLLVKDNEESEEVETVLLL